MQAAKSRRHSGAAPTYRPISTGSKNGEASLATTPMEFSYSGGEGIPGFGRGNPFADAWDSAVASFATMASFLLLAIGVLLPWLMLGVLLVALWRTPPLRKLRGMLRARREEVPLVVDKP
jgi:hypothetical protein